MYNRRPDSYGGYDASQYIVPGTSYVTSVPTVPPPYTDPHSAMPQAWPTQAYPPGYPAPPGAMPYPTYPAPASYSGYAASATGHAADYRPEYAAQIYTHATSYGSSGPTHEPSSDAHSKRKVDPDPETDDAKRTRMVKSYYDDFDQQFDDYANPITKSGSSRSVTSDSTDEAARDKMVVYLGNITRDMTSEEVRKLLSGMSGVLDIALARHSDPMSKKTCAFIEMASKSEAQNVTDKYRGFVYNGRPLLTRLADPLDYENMRLEFTEKPALQLPASGSSSDKEKKLQLYIGNIPIMAMPADLLNFLQPYPHSGVRMKKSPTTSNRHSIEFAFVDFKTEENAQKCYEYIQPAMFHHARLSYELLDTRDTSSTSQDLLSKYAEVEKQATMFSKTPTAVPKMQKIEAEAIRYQRTDTRGERYNAVSTFDDLIAGHESEPLLGLEYISEYVTCFKRQSRFICYVCELYVDGSALVTHLLGNKHQLKYLEKHRPDLFEQINNVGKHEQHNELLKIATEIEDNFGRQEIKVVYYSKTSKSKGASSTKILEILKRNQSLPGAGSVAEVSSTTLDSSDRGSGDLFSRIASYKKRVAEHEKIHKDEKKGHHDVGHAHRLSEREDRDRREREDRDRRERKDRDDGDRWEREDRDRWEREAKQRREEDEVERRRELREEERMREEHEDERRQEERKERHRKEREEDRRKEERRQEFLEKRKKEDAEKKKKEELLKKKKEEEKKQREAEAKKKKEAWLRKKKEEEKKKMEEERKKRAEEKKREIEEKKREEERKRKEEVERKRAFEKKKEEITTAIRRTEKREMKCKLKQMIKGSETPMLGLSFITELQTPSQPDSPKYTCSLCDCNCGINFIIPHITGLQHRTKFMEKFHEEEYQQVANIANRNEKRAKIEHHAKLIEVDMGREEVVVEVLDEPKIPVTVIQSPEGTQTDAAAVVKQQVGGLRPKWHFEVPKTKTHVDSPYKKQKLDNQHEVKKPEAQTKVKKIDDHSKMKNPKVQGKETPKAKPKFGMEPPKAKPIIGPQPNPNVGTQGSPKVPTIKDGQDKHLKFVTKAVSKNQTETRAAIENKGERVLVDKQGLYTCSECGFSEISPGIVAGHKYKAGHPNATTLNNKVFEFRKTPEKTDDVPPTPKQPTDPNKLDVEDFDLLQEFEEKLFRQPQNLTNDENWRSNNPYICGQCGFRCLNRVAVQKHKVQLGHYNADIFYNNELFQLLPSTMEHFPFCCSKCGYKGNSWNAVLDHISQKNKHHIKTAVLFRGFLYSADYSDAVKELREAKLMKEKVAKGNLIVVASSTASLSVGETKAPVSVGDTKVPVSVGDTKAPVSVGDTKVPVSVGDTKAPVSVGDTKTPVSVTRDAKSTAVSVTSATKTVVSSGGMGKTPIDTVIKTNDKTSHKVIDLTLVSDDKDKPVVIDLTEKPTHKPKSSITGHQQPQKVQAVQTKKSTVKRDKADLIMCAFCGFEATTRPEFEKHKVAAGHEDAMALTWVEALAEVARTRLDKPTKYSCSVCRYGSDFTSLITYHIKHIKQSDARTHHALATIVDKSTTKPLQIADVKPAAKGGCTVEVLVGDKGGVKSQMKSIESIPAVLNKACVVSVYDWLTEKGTESMAESDVQSLLEKFPYPLGSRVLPDELRQTYMKGGWRCTHCNKHLPQRRAEACHHYWETHMAIAPIHCTVCGEKYARWSDFKYKHKSCKSEESKGVDIGLNILTTLPKPRFKCDEKIGSPDFVRTEKLEAMKCFVYETTVNEVIQHLTNTSDKSVIESHGLSVVETSEINSNIDDKKSKPDEQEWDIKTGQTGAKMEAESLKSINEDTDVEMKADSTCKSDKKMEVEISKTPQKELDVEMKPVKVAETKSMRVGQFGLVEGIKDIKDEAMEDKSENLCILNYSEHLLAELETVLKLNSFEMDQCQFYKEVIAKKGQHTVDKKGQHTVDKEGQHTVDKEGQHTVDKEGQHTVDKEGQHTVDKKGQHTQHTVDKNFIEQNGKAVHGFLDIHKPDGDRISLQSVDVNVCTSMSSFTQCRLCAAIGPSLDWFQAHYKCHKDGETVYFCSHCGHYGNTQDELQKHLNQVGHGRMREIAASLVYTGHDNSAPFVTIPRRVLLEAAGVEGLSDDDDFDWAMLAEILTDKLRDRYFAAANQPPLRPGYWTCTSCGHICPDAPTSHWRHFALVHNEQAPFTCSSCWLRSTDEGPVVSHQKSICQDGRPVVDENKVFPLTFGPQADFLQMTWRKFHHLRCLVCSCGFKTMVTSVMTAHTSDQKREHIYSSKQLTSDNLHEAIRDWNTAVTLPADEIKAVKKYLPLEWNCRVCRATKRLDIDPGIDSAPLQLWPIKHYIFKHSPEPPYFCGLCGFKAISRERVRRHIYKRNHGSEYEILQGEKILYPSFNIRNPHITLDFCDDSKTPPTKRISAAKDVRATRQAGDSDSEEDQERSTVGTTDAVAIGEISPPLLEQDSYHIEHLRKYKGEPLPGYLWKCTSCGMCVTKYRLAVMHYHLYHSEAPPYQCGDCGFPGCNLRYIEYHLHITGHCSENVRKADDVAVPRFIGDHKDFQLVKAAVADVTGRGEQHMPCSPGDGFKKSLSVEWQCGICNHSRSFKMVARQQKELMSHPFEHHRTHILSVYTCADCHIMGTKRLQMQNHCGRENHRLVTAEPVFDGPNPDAVLKVLEEDDTGSQKILSQDVKSPDKSDKSDNKAVGKDKSDSKSPDKVAVVSSKPKETDVKSSKTDVKSDGSKSPENEAKKSTEVQKSHEKDAEATGKEVEVTTSGKSTENVSKSPEMEIEHDWVAALHGLTRSHSYCVVPWKPLYFIKDGGPPDGYLWKCTSCGLITQQESAISHFLLYHAGYSCSVCGVQTMTDADLADHYASGVHGFVTDEDAVKQSRVTYPLFFGPQADLVPIKNEKGLKIDYQKNICSPGQVVKAYYPMCWMCKLCGRKEKCPSHLGITSADLTGNLKKFPLEHFAMQHSQVAPFMCQCGRRLVDRAAMETHCKVVKHDMQVAKRGNVTIPNLVGENPDMILVFIQPNIPNLMPWFDIQAKKFNVGKQLDMMRDKLGPAAIIKTKKVETLIEKSLHDPSDKQQQQQQQTTKTATPTELQTDTVSKITVTVTPVKSEVQTGTQAKSQTGTQAKSQIGAKDKKQSPAEAKPHSDTKTKTQTDTKAKPPTDTKTKPQASKAQTVDPSAKQQPQTVTVTVEPAISKGVIKGAEEKARTQVKQEQITGPPVEPKKQDEDLIVPGKPVNFLPSDASIVRNYFWQCAICGVAYDYHKAVSHFRHFHSLYPTHSCSQCGFRTLLLKDLDRHRLSALHPPAEVVDRRSEPDLIMLFGPQPDLIPVSKDTSLGIIKKACTPGSKTKTYLPMAWKCNICGDEVPIIKSVCREDGAVTSDILKTIADKHFATQHYQDLDHYACNTCLFAAPTLAEMQRHQSVTRNKHGRYRSLHRSKYPHLCGGNPDFTLIIDSSHVEEAAKITSPIASAKSEISKTPTTSSAVTDKPSKDIGKPVTVTASVDGKDTSVKPATDTGKDTTVKPATDTGKVTTVKPATDTGKDTTVKPATDTGKVKTVKPATDTGKVMTVKPATDTGKVRTVKPATDTGKVTTVKPATDTGKVRTVKPATDTGKVEPMSDSLKAGTAKPSSDSGNMRTVKRTNVPGKAMTITVSMGSTKDEPLRTASVPESGLNVTYVTGISIEGQAAPFMDIVTNPHPPVPTSVWTCTACGENLPFSRTARHFMHYHNKTAMYLCDGCGFRGETKAHVRAHISSVKHTGQAAEVLWTDDQTQPFYFGPQADFIPYDSWNKPVMGVKEKSCLPGELIKRYVEMVWACNLCGEAETAWNDDLSPNRTLLANLGEWPRNHYKKKHVSSKTIPFTCGDCSARFKREGEVKEHCVKKWHNVSNIIKGSSVMPILSGVNKDLDLELKLKQDVEVKTVQDNVVDNVDRVQRKYEAVATSVEVEINDRVEEKAASDISKTHDLDDKKSSSVIDNIDKRTTDNIIEVQVFVGKMDSPEKVGDSGAHTTQTSLAADSKELTDESDKTGKQSMPIFNVSERVKGVRALKRELLDDDKNVDDSDKKFDDIGVREVKYIKLDDEVLDNTPAVFKKSIPRSRNIRKPIDDDGDDENRGKKKGNKRKGSSDADDMSEEEFDMDSFMVLDEVGEVDSGISVSVELSKEPENVGEERVQKDKESKQDDAKISSKVSREKVDRRRSDGKTSSKPSSSKTDSRLSKSKVDGGHEKAKPYTKVSQGKSESTISLSSKDSQLLTEAKRHSEVTDKKTKTDGNVSGTTSGKVPSENLERKSATGKSGERLFRESSEKAGTSSSRIKRNVIAVTIELGGSDPDEKSTSGKTSQNVMTDPIAITEKKENVVQGGRKRKAGTEGKVIASKKPKSSPGKVHVRKSLTGVIKVTKDLPSGTTDGSSEKNIKMVTSEQVRELSPSLGMESSAEEHHVTETKLDKSSVGEDTVCVSDNEILSDKLHEDNKNSEKTDKDIRDDSITETVDSKISETEELRDRHNVKEIETGDLIIKHKPVTDSSLRQHDADEILGVASPSGNAIISPKRVKITEKNDNVEKSKTSLKVKLIAKDKSDPGKLKVTETSVGVVNIPKDKSDKTVHVTSNTDSKMDASGTGSVSQTSEAELEQKEKKPAISMSSICSKHDKYNDKTVPDEKGVKQLSDNLQKDNKTSVTLETKNKVINMSESSIVSDTVKYLSVKMDTIEKLHEISHLIKSSVTEPVEGKQSDTHAVSRTKIKHRTETIQERKSDNDNKTSEATEVDNESIKIGETVDNSSDLTNVSEVKSTKIIDHLSGLSECSKTVDNPSDLINSGKGKSLEPGDGLSGLVDRGEVKIESKATTTVMPKSTADSGVIGSKDTSTADNREVKIESKDTSTVMQKPTAGSGERKIESKDTSTVMQKPTAGSGERKIESKDTSTVVQKHTAGSGERKIESKDTGTVMQKPTAGSGERKIESKDMTTVMQKPTADSPSVSKSVGDLANITSPSGNVYVCPECEKVCKSKGGLGTHRRVHKK